MNTSWHHVSHPDLATLDSHGSVRLDAQTARHLAAQFVAHLRQSGVPARSRVLFSCANSPALLSAVLGCLLAEYLPVVLSAKLTHRERDELTADVAPALVVDDATLSQCFAEEPVLLTTVVTCRPMHFTSGTSGQPKGVFSGWLSATHAQMWVAEEQKAWGITAQDTYLAAAPMSHSAPLRFPLITLLSGGTVVIPAGGPSGFDADVVSALIRDEHVSTTFFAPSHLQRLLATAAPTHHNMRLMAHAGSACPENIRQHARAIWGDDVVREFYGSTEGQFTICTPAEFDTHPGTLGRARPGRELRAEPDGRLWCKAPEHARFEYWADPDKTGATWDGDWFTVGDLGRIDADGYVYLEGRRSDLIITGGVNVYPAEVERIALQLSGVEQACVFGVTDERWGQKVWLAYTGPATADDINRHCAQQLAPYKRPKEITTMTEFPLTHSGKIDRLQIEQIATHPAQRLE